MSEKNRGGLGAAAVPILILIALAGLIFAVNPGEYLVRDGAPPVEELIFSRTILDDDGIHLKVTNEGPDPVTIAQVLVDEAYWQHTIEPTNKLRSLQSATIHIPYPWVEGDDHEVVILTESGITFEHGIEAALATPTSDASTIGIYALIGLFVGVLPIFAGIAWFPAIRRAGKRVELGILAFTIGLLAFLVVESVEESLELAELAPGPLGGPGLVLLGIAVAMAALILVGARLAGKEQPGSHRARLVTAYLIATGIGLHNLGEGLAIGAAYALGEVALGAFLILGFTLHNVTEGPAIVAPLRRKTALFHLGLMGVIAGVPTIFGAWIGGLAFSPFLGALFFALGAGAMLQVIIHVWDGMREEPAFERFKGTIAAGAVIGVGVMWATGLLI